MFLSHAIKGIVLLICVCVCVSMDFNEYTAKAIDHLNIISKNIGPRQIGSSNLHIAFDYVEELVKKLELSNPSIYHSRDLFSGASLSTPGRLTFYHGIPSLIVVLEPISQCKDYKLPPIIFNSHLDTATQSPGTFDNAVGVSTAVTLLEYYSISNNHSKLCSTLVFLFNGAEEILLLGSQAFKSHILWGASNNNQLHQKIKNIFFRSPSQKEPDGIFINLEGGGRRGRPSILQSSARSDFENLMTKIISEMNFGSSFSSLQQDVFGVFSNFGSMRLSDFNVLSYKSSQNAPSRQQQLNHAVEDSGQVMKSYPILSAENSKMSFLRFPLGIDFIPLKDNKGYHSVFDSISLQDFEENTDYSRKLLFSLFEDYLDMMSRLITTLSNQSSNSSPASGSSGGVTQWLPFYGNIYLSHESVIAIGIVWISVYMASITSHTSWSSSSGRVPDFAKAQVSFIGVLATSLLLVGFNLGCCLIVASLLGGLLENFIFSQSQIVKLISNGEIFSTGISIFTFFWVFLGTYFGVTGSSIFASFLSKLSVMKNNKQTPMISRRLKNEETDANASTTPNSPKIHDSSLHPDLFASIIKSRQEASLHLTADLSTDPMRIKKRKSICVPQNLNASTAITSQARSKLNDEDHVNKSKFFSQEDEKLEKERQTIDAIALSSESEVEDDDGNSVFNPNKRRLKSTAPLPATSLTPSPQVPYPRFFSLYSTSISFTFLLLAAILFFNNVATYSNIVIAGFCVSVANQIQTPSKPLLARIIRICSVIPATVWCLEFLINLELVHNWSSASRLFDVPRFAALSSTMGFIMSLFFMQVLSPIPSPPSALDDRTARAHACRVDLLASRALSSVSKVLKKFLLLIGFACTVCLILPSNSFSYVETILLDKYTRTTAGSNGMLQTERGILALWPKHHISAAKHACMLASYADENWRQSSTCTSLVNKATQAPIPKVSSYIKTPDSSSVLELSPRTACNSRMTQQSQIMCHLSQPGRHPNAEGLVHKGSEYLFRYSLGFDDDKAVAYKTAQPATPIHASFHDERLLSHILPQNMFDPSHSNPFKVSKFFEEVNIRTKYRRRDEVHMEVAYGFQNDTAIFIVSGKAPLYIFEVCGFNMTGDKQEDLAVTIEQRSLTGNDLIDEHSAKNTLGSTIKLLNYSQFQSMSNDELSSSEFTGLFNLYLSSKKLGCMKMSFVRGNGDGSQGFEVRIHARFSHRESHLTDKMSGASASITEIDTVSMREADLIVLPDKVPKLTGDARLSVLQGYRNHLLIENLARK